MICGHTHNGLVCTQWKNHKGPHVARGTHPLITWKSDPTMTIEKFWTITSDHTSFTNDKSARFVTLEVAIAAAERRLNERPDVQGVIVLEAAFHVRKSAPPIVVTRINEPNQGVGSSPIQPRKFFV